MINVVEYEQTSWACPSQWEGTTDEGWFVYARYRHGWFSLDHAPSREAWTKMWKDWEVLSGQHGDDLDGVMSDEKLREITEGVVTWP